LFCQLHYSWHNFEAVGFFSNHCVCGFIEPTPVWLGERPQLSTTERQRLRLPRAPEKSVISRLLRS